MQVDCFDNINTRFHTIITHMKIRHIIIPQPFEWENVSIRIKGNNGRLPRVFPCKGKNFYQLFIIMRKSLFTFFNPLVSKF